MTSYNKMASTVRGHIHTINVNLLKLPNIFSFMDEEYYQYTGMIM